MHVVDANAIYLDDELLEFPESLLLGPPVELLGPIIQQIPQPFEIRPLRPRSARCAIRPTCVPNACPEVGEDLLSNRYLEGLYTQSRTPRE
jgi:hypothetical protein